jgi:predicted metal-dependent hydrolase
MSEDGVVGQEQVQFGEQAISYSVTYAKRKTLGITVHPDLSVEVRAPNHSDPAVVAAVVRRRAPWILRQQREFEQYPPTQPPRRYVSGETHRYLGRQYRLKVQELSATVSASVPAIERVKLSGGFLYVWTVNPYETEQVRTLVDEWYRRQAERVFGERLETLLPRFQHLTIASPKLNIRRMKARWGSCGANGMVTLNLKLIQVSKPLIDYVIVHELCHLVEHNHSKRYYALLDRMLPDWRTRRQQLNEAEVSG